ncbi:MAG: RNA polymerase factor sigma-54 [Bacteroidaceae bacterium]|nr:RNA polymerase factor sigma-54 [Bacteroidaceae bacterium]
MKNSIRHNQQQHQEQTQEMVMMQHKLQVAATLLAEKGLAEFEETVRKEMDDNPALEERDEWTDEEEPSFDEDTNGEENGEPESEETGRDADYDNGRDDMPKDDDGLDLSDYVSNEPRYAADYVNEITAINTQTFYETLIEQMNDYDLDETDQEIMRYIISSLDGNGYLTKDVDSIMYEVSFKLYIDTTPEHIERLVHILQKFEPHGLGARNLQECLWLQAKALPDDVPLKSHALKALDEYFTLFSTLSWTTLQKRLKLNDENFEALKKLLMRLNPKPGNQLNIDVSSNAPTIIPDFYVEVNDEGELVVSMNNGDVPELCVSPSYLQTIREFSHKKTHLTKEMEDQLLFVQSKVDAARNFINKVKLRKLMLYNVAKCIVDTQGDFFLNEDDETLLHPLKMEEIASTLNISVSTVSRVIRSKFIQTPYGLYPLKMFFIQAFTSDDGVEISAHHALLKLQEIVDREDKRSPLSDMALADAMKEAGFPIARRTIAKYRDRLNIPEKRLRKQK